MKLNHFIGLGFCSLALVNQASAQPYTDVTTPLEITDDRAVEENYYNRINAGIFIDNTEASYLGRNVDITEGKIVVIDVGSFNLTADEGTWNTIVANEEETIISNPLSFTPDDAIIRIGTSATSVGGGTGVASSGPIDATISNTRISSSYSDAWAIGVFGDEKSTSVALDNVEINTFHNGIVAFGKDALITSRGEGVTINASETQFVVSAMNYGTIDLHNATINVAEGTPEYAPGQCSVLNANNATISLTDSRISSASGNVLMSGFPGSGGSNIFNLSNVNLDHAKNQVILSLAEDHWDASTTVNFSNGTNFDGYAGGCYTLEEVFEIADAGGNPLYSPAAINITITSGASWNVTQNSNLNSIFYGVDLEELGFEVLGTLLTGSLTLGDASTISFVSMAGTDTFSDDFTNINAAAIMLESGSILQLDKDASVFEVGDVITLFEGAEGDGFTNDGALMITADGQYINYIDYDNGTFGVLGFYSLVPEPATATFGLAALGLMALRRKKSALVG